MGKSRASTDRDRMAGLYVAKCKGVLCGWPLRPGASCASKCGWASGHGTKWWRKVEGRRWRRDVDGR